MNLIPKQSKLQDRHYVHELRMSMEQKGLLNERGELDLSVCSDQEFLEIFFLEEINNEDRGKPLSPQTLKAYRTDAQTLLSFMGDYQLTFKGIGFPEVRMYNRYINEKYAARSAARNLNFFRRLLAFGYKTHFYKGPLYEWIKKPAIKKGHYSDSLSETQTYSEVRELSQRDAEELIGLFSKLVKQKAYRLQRTKRNELLGHLLYKTGMRASEIVSLNWGSFRYNRRGQVNIDVIGKGNKQRTIPVIDERFLNALFEYRKSFEESIELDPYDRSPLFFSIQSYYNEETRFNKKRMSYKNIYHIVKAATKFAEKNPHVSPHWFRHTYITTLLENDVPLSVVKQLAGHEDISTTNIYLERIEKEKLHDHISHVKFGL
jgi:integrase/recombinase XerD